jgi:hypothetical protein
LRFASSRSRRKRWKTRRATGTPLVNPAFGTGSRYNLIFVAHGEGGQVIEEYGADPLGAWRYATTTSPPCREDDRAALEDLG